MSIIVTGAAGFIGMHVAQKLLQQGQDVIGIDNFNPYYDVGLKRQRWQQLVEQAGFTGIEADLTNAGIYAQLPTVDGIIHLAAQAGVRYARENPALYVDANLKATTLLFDHVARQCPNVPVIYASSSSVYGRNSKIPFSEDDPVNQPASLYAATKRACELTADVYHHLYGLNLTGLRFFTVYGPQGRPDMAYWMFAKAILQGKPITLFDGGQHKRDFTYIDDIVTGILAALNTAPQSTSHRIYNLGNNQPEVVRDLLAILEDKLGCKAVIDEQPAGKDEVQVTYANIDRAMRELNYKPQTRLTDGLGRFVDWYLPYYQQSAAA